MELSVFTVPYDTGQRDLRMGRGPQRLLDAGLVARCEAAGHAVEVATIAAPAGPLVPEPRHALGVWQALATGVSDARTAGRFPLILTGICHSAVGTVSGLGLPGTTVWWFDAHGDFNTPETSPTGFLDGMAVAILAGRCWRGLTSAVPGFAPLPESDVTMIGVRDLDPGEQQLLDGSPVARGDLDGAIARHAGRPAYLHVDLDVLDPGEGAVNHLPVPGGLTAAGLRDACGRIAGRTDVRGMTLSAYDPAGDPEGRIAAVALDLVVETLARIG